MEQIAALLLIVGCSDDVSQCNELPAPTAFYESAIECEHDVNGALRAFSADYPQLYAQCVSFDADLMDGDAEIVWTIDDAQHLLASVEPVGMGRREIASSADGDSGTTALQ